MKNIFTEESGQRITAELFSSFRHKKIDLYGKPAPQVQYPTVPQTLQALGIPFDLITKLLLKHLLVGGTMRSDELASKMALPLSLIEEPTHFLRDEALVETRGAQGGSGVSGIMQLLLTDRGRERARNYLDESSYCGPLPVTLENYSKQVMAQSVRRQIASRDDVQKVYADIVVNENVLTQIGAAFNSGGTLFMYGAPGTGKTFLATQMLKMLQGNIAIPYAVIVDGQIIRVYDPLNHKVVGENLKDNPVVSPDLHRHPVPDVDARWVICHRPVIISGSELTLDMIDLQYQPDIGFYEAPLQMKANGGIFLIDDLGRQIVQPKTLLNRWIVPLENEVDYLGLHTGSKFQIPFDLIPVFATNIRPEELADEAFLRRLGYKIHIDYVTEQEFHSIFEQYCLADNIEYNADMVDFLIHEYYRPASKPMAACHPRDLINKVIDFSLFEGEGPRLSKELLAMAWEAYFVTSDN
ncbi:AAA family ATPase [Sulfuriflexus sp.]|uniref:AAA family ATPase n=1 Tax=Sulfuriflexus sp. TaxID=2015443 RepID=UPI0028CE8968|nr:AAA family ATPase [Sulfuriflexus sp.]MDT8403042.1 AAA family ATPase [Sulfuriflexus sp.]